MHKGQIRKDLWDNINEESPISKREITKESRMPTIFKPSPADYTTLSHRFYSTTSDGKTNLNQALQTTQHSDTEFIARDLTEIPN